MRKTIAGLLVCLTLALLLLSSCASTFEQATMAMDTGDYTAAIVKSLESIEKGKDVPEATAVLNTAWQRANSEWSAHIATIEQATTADELAKAIPLYNKLLEIHKLVAEAGRTELKPDREAVLQKALQTQQRLAEMHFDEASATLALGGRENARKAVFQYRRVKELAPDYTGIDFVIEEATKQATVKVFVFTGPDTNYAMNGVEMIPMVEKQLASLEFIEIVSPPNRYAAPIGDDHDAKNFARGHKADIMLHFEPKTTWKVETQRDARPINGSVTAAPDWKIEKLSMVASATCEISYIVVDLETENTLDSGTFTVKDTTDFGFSVQAVLSTGNKEKLQIGNMAKAELLQKNTMATGATSNLLASQLKLFEKMDLPNYGFETGIAPARYGTFDPIDFSKYSTPDELARIQDLNGHVFFLFEVIESVNNEAKSYSSPYGEYYGEGFAGRVKTAQFDMQVYNDLRVWMTSKKTNKAVQEAFLPKFYTETVPAKVAQKVSGALK